MPFRPGKSGNRNGRPKGSTVKRDIAVAFQEFLAGKEGGKTRFDAAMRRLYRDDLKTFFAYAYGKPVETQIVQNPDSSNLISPEIIQAAAAVAELLQKKAIAENETNRD